MGVAAACPARHRRDRHPSRRADDPVAHAPPVRRGRIHHPFRRHRHVECDQLGLRPAQGAPHMDAAMIRTAAILALCACSACTTSAEYRETRAELQRYSMMQTRGDVAFLPGGLGEGDLAGDLPEQYARLQKEAVSCRSDILVGARGSVTHICTTC